MFPTSSLMPPPTRATQSLVENTRRRTLKGLLMCKSQMLIPRKTNQGHPPLPRTGFQLSLYLQRLARKSRPLASNPLPPTRANLRARAVPPRPTVVHLHLWSKGYAIIIVRIHRCSTLGSRFVPDPQFRDFRFRHRESRTSNKDDRSRPLVSF
jgi:hypothetical protein